MEMQVHTSGAEIGVLKTPGRESLAPDSAQGLTYEQIVEIGSGVQELRGSAGVCVHARGVLLACSHVVTHMLPKGQVVCGHERRRVGYARC